jgi:hypothetical protein
MTNEEHKYLNPDCQYCKGTGEIKAVNETTSTVSYYHCFGDGAMSGTPIRTESTVSVTNNTQLPAEVVQSIKGDANKVYNKLDDLAHEQDSYDFGLPMINRETGPIIEILTEYATKLHHAQQEIESLTNQLKNHGKVSDENMKLLRQENEKARTLLQKFISRHEGGLLPDRFIYNEIKTFLDGTK